MTPTSISLHPTSGFIAHYADRQVPFSQLLPEERGPLLAQMVERYNEHEALVERAEAVAEETPV